MKKLFCFLMIIFPSIIFAQPHFGSVKLGIFNPSATEAGFIIGYEGGWAIDNNFIIGLSADWFNKNYVDQNLVTQFNDYYGVNSSLNEIRAKTNLHAIPLMGTATASFPISPRTNLFFTGGVGVEVLLIFYRNYDNPDNNDFHGAFDFAWQIGSGVAYELGPRSDVLVELSYHNSQPSWDYNVYDPNTGRSRVFQRSFDMSGVMMRAGFRFYF
ncbi:MAG: outer membrane beta-barrel protein [Bacteroidetes bacterium]|nr:outer membrane beta-barrel protein [Bacteroidota bacterium]